MWDWSLGQAGFGEQIQLYGETFWRQVGSVLFWLFVVILAVLMIVAIIGTVSRLTEVTEETGGPRLPEDITPATRARPDRTRPGTAEPGAPRAA